MPMSMRSLRMVFLGRPACLSAPHAYRPGQTSPFVVYSFRRMASQASSPADKAGKAEPDTTTSEPALPPLSPAEFRQYNSMAETMEAYHNHFRQSWTMLYNACTQRQRPAGMSIRQFVDEGLRFIQGLTMHHGIEEAHIFPVLAQRMIEFQPVKNNGKNAQDNGTAALLVRQHREIHVGMDAFEAYLKRCRSGETDLNLGTLRELMDSWGTVLWQHLDDEVATLRAENMRKYWTLAEMRRLPM